MRKFIGIGLVLGLAVSLYVVETNDNNKSNSLTVESDYLLLNDDITNADNLIKLEDTNVTFNWRIGLTNATGTFFNNASDHNQTVLNINDTYIIPDILLYFREPYELALKWNNEGSLKRFYDIN